MSTTYKITGMIVFENGKVRRIDDRMTREMPAINKNNVIKEYLVQWAMVERDVIDDWKLEIEVING